MFLEGPTEGVALLVLAQHKSSEGFVSYSGPLPLFPRRRFLKTSYFLYFLSKSFHSFG